MRGLLRKFSFIDMRSDTVTLPTSEVRRAWETESLHSSQLDKLEQKAAELAGKEACVWLPSGTMSNVMGIMSVCPRGTQVILGQKSHVYEYEQGGVASLGGVMPYPVVNQPDGSLRLEDIKAVLKPEFPTFARTSAVALENTHGVRSGKVLKPEYVQQVKEFCLQHGFKLYLDGARVLNAYVALKEASPSLRVADVLAPYDAVNICLSKGLSCPYGSVLVSDEQTIARARKYRDALGGDISQAGAAAVSGLVALDNFEEWLKADHANAALLARQLKSFGYSVGPYETNILQISLAKTTSAVLSAELRRHGILANPMFEGNEVRLVTHTGLTSAIIAKALEAFRQIAVSSTT
jgi:threonine aldolase